MAKKLMEIFYIEVENVDTARRPPIFTMKLLKPIYFENVQIWSPQSKPVEGYKPVQADQGTEPGPFLPVALYPSQDRTLPLTCSVVIQFPAGWRGNNSRYYLKGEGPAGTIIKTDTLDVPDQAVLYTKPKNFKLQVNNATRTSPGLAFRDSGLWRWSITRVNGQHEEVTYIQETRLEMYFFPAGLRDLFSQGIDLKLLRLMVPFYNEIYVNGTSSLANIYQKIVQKTWDHAKEAPQIPYTNAVGGHGEFTDTADSRTTFFMGSWLNKDGKKQCNCGDVAAFINVCCQLLGIPSTRVQTSPFGYIRPGPLIGLDDDQHANCNSPFHYYAPPYVDPMSKDRTRFAAHAWIEVPAPNGGVNDVVLDAVHSTGRAPGGLAHGTQDRPTYHRESTEEGYYSRNPTPTLNFPWPPQNSVYQTLPDVQALKYP